MLIFDSFPPKIGEVHFSPVAERAILHAQFMDRKDGSRSRTVSIIGEQVTSTLLCMVASVEEGTGDATRIAHSLWEGHPVLSHQPDHGAFIAGIDDAQRKFHSVMDIAEDQIYERLVRKEIPV